MTQVLEIVKKQTVLRVLSQDTVYYVVLDDKGGVNAFYDERCASPAGLWHWQEKEVSAAVKEYMNAQNEVGKSVVRNS